MTNRFRSDDGQSTVEWIGIAAVVVALALVVASFSSSMGASAGEAFVCLVKQAAGTGDCGRPEVGENGPTKPCVVSSENTRVELGAKIVIVDVDGSYGYIVEELSDGTVRVTEVVKGQAGASVGVGGGVVVNAGDARGGERAAAGAKAAGYVELGDSWVFPNRGEADEHIENTLVDRGVSAIPGANLPGVNSAVKWGLGKFGVGGNDVEGEHESTRVEVGVVGVAVAEAIGGVSSGSVGAGLETAAGLTKYDDGRIDATFEVSREVAGNLGIPGLADLDLGVGGSAEITVSFNPDGSVGSVGLKVTGTVRGQADLGSPDQALNDLANNIVDPQDATRQVVLEYELDTDSPELRGAAVDFITSLAPGGESAGDGASRLGDALVDNSTLTKQIYELDDSRYGVDANGEFIVGGRLSANLIRENSKLIEASYFDPATGTFRPWVNCTG
ncbi:MAG: hypothetical protein ACR2HR_14620 [Euzebya sp.]